MFTPIGPSPERLTGAEVLAFAQRVRDDRQQFTSTRAMTSLRVALLGTFTTSFVAKVLDVFLLSVGIDATIDESPYAGWMDHALNARSPLYDTKPDVVALLTHEEAVSERPAVFSSESDAASLARSEVARWAALWSAIHARLPATIVQSNFPLPDANPTGSLDGTAPWGRVRYLRRVNEELSRASRPGVAIFDAEYIASGYGLHRAIDRSVYQLSKQPFAFDFLPTYCHRLARLIASTQGRAKKCVVLDLDDTLWGGTVGEDGAEAIVVGPDFLGGESFTAFQRYVKGLRERGVLLAVCSKNDEKVALDAFARRADMPLRVDDFACFVANWEDKASNVKRIARTLNIGLDSMVFVDNSAEERALIRIALPEVTVVELPDDPDGYVAAIDRCALFELTEVSSEGAQRTQRMQEEQARQGLASSFVDYDAYLQSLALEARFAPVGPDNLTRVAELLQRTNQFNLRTVRHSAEQIRQFVATPGNVAFAVSLADRFGTHGTISVVMLRRDEDLLFVDTWLMSCRVLKRGVEAMVANRIVEEGRRAGVRSIIGEYRPSGKNGMVAELYPSLGFALRDEDANGRRYRVDVSADTARTHFIKDASAP